MKVARVPVLLVALLAGTQLASAQAAPTRQGKLSPLQMLEAAHALFVQGDFEGARKYYLEVLPSFPKNFDLLKNLGFCFYTMGPRGFAQAAHYYSQAYDINPNSKEVLENLVKTLRGLNRNAEAAALLRKKAQSPDAPADVWKALAEAYDAARMISEAETAYDAYLQRQPGDLDARSSLGRLYSWEKDYGKAMEQFRIVLAANPNFSAALIGTAHILSWQGQYEDSLLLYERVLRLNPGNGEAETGKAFVLLWVGRPEEAQALFSVLHRRYPRDAEVTRGLETAQAALEEKVLAAARESGSTSQAEIFYRQRMAKDPGDVSALAALARFTANPQHCMESIEYCRKALDISPDDISVELALARSLALCQQYAEAAVRYRRYLEGNPKSEDAFFELGQTLERSRRTSEAMEAYRNLLELSPQNTDATLGLARTLAVSGNYTEAALRYDEALQRFPDNYDALQGKAYVLYWTGQFAQARVIFQSLAALRSSDPQNAQALADISRAEEEARWAALRPPPQAPLKDYLPFYQKRLASYPDDASALKGLAYIQGQLQDLPAAVEGYRRVLAKYPDDRDARMELARLLSQEGKYDEPIKLYQEVLKKQPDDTDALDNLARVYLWSDHPAESLTIYQSLLARNPSNLGYQMQVARLELQLKDYPAAREALASVLSTDPRNREARLQLAQLDLRQGLQKESLHNFDQLLSQNPEDPDALLGKAQISYTQGNFSQARSSASAVVKQRPDNFDAVFLLANVEHAHGHRRAARAYLDQAERISPGNPEVRDVRNRLHEESAATLHTSASFAREIGPATESTGTSFVTGNSVVLSGRPNEDIRLFSYGTTITIPITSHLDSYFSFTSLPTDSPPSPIRGPSGQQIPTAVTGAVAPAAFLYRQTWRPSRLFTLRIGSGVARFGPGEVDRSPQLTGQFNNLLFTFGSQITNIYGVQQEHATVASISPMGLAGITVAPWKKFSFDIDWNRGPFIYLPTPYAMKRGLRQNRYEGGLNFFFARRTEMHINYWRAHLFSDPLTHLDLSGAFLQYQPPNTTCSQGTPLSSTSTSTVCLVGGTVNKIVQRDEDHGRGGSLEFLQNVRQAPRSSFNLGYEGQIYEFQGRAKGIFLGFFNPQFYQRQLLTARLYGEMFGPVGYDFSGGIGVQQTEHGSALTRATNISPSFTLKVSEHLTLGVGYTHYNTAQALGTLRGNAFRLTTDWKM